MRRAVSFFFVEPGHLDGLEDLLVALVGVALEARQLADPLVQIGEAHAQGIDIRESLVQRDGDVLHILPAQLLGHVGPSKKIFFIFSAARDPWPPPRGVPWGARRTRFSRTPR